ncbi:hypothetical protein B0T16DRAFT_121984 [Cercophora newfieldiana]|uniref:Secreted protein n=1 Tax=Cercophora newfieldiana TaxID=92897 RepID=A0AA40CRR6_9PEZI|nr:hypothetical protein B0T16DRAFT_121984 [Cercophora newfieldiana]
MLGIAMVSVRWCASSVAFLFLSYPLAPEDLNSCKGEYFSLSLWPDRINSAPCSVRMFVFEQEKPRAPPSEAPSQHAIHHGYLPDLKPIRRPSLLPITPRSKIQQNASRDLPNAVLPKSTFPRIIKICQCSLHARHRAPGPHFLP